VIIKASNSSRTSDSGVLFCRRFSLQEEALVSVSEAGVKTSHPHSVQWTARRRLWINPSAISATSIRSFLPQLCRESARESRWHQLQEATRDFDPRYNMIFDLLLLKGNYVFFLFGIWLFTATRRVIQGPPHDTERYAYGLRRQKQRVKQTTLLDVLKELTRLQPRHTPFHSRHSRVSSHSRRLVNPWSLGMSPPCLQGGLP
jgi:hypothetical protein